MKTPEEIKKGLSICTCKENARLDRCESGCPYHIEGSFQCNLMDMMQDALAYIHLLEERIDGMLFQMMGDCGTCKHRHDADNKTCIPCLTSTKGTHPLWEYEGFPTDMEKED